MADTTIGRVRAIAPNLDNLPDSTIQMYIDDAKQELESLKYNPKFEERLQRYLAAHFGTLQNPRIKSESVEGLSQTYVTSTEGKDELKSTEYGQEVKRLLKKSGFNMLVIS